LRSDRTILALVLAVHASVARGQTTSSPLTLLDVPFMSQSEALCGGAAAAMVMRYWGEREVSSDSFSHLLDRAASGVHTDALVADLERRGWTVSAVEGDDDLVLREIDRARPVIALIEDRPRRYHYVVVVGWHARGVVFHDPARAAYRVMSRAEFDRRWDATNRWMAVVVPSSSNGVDKPQGLVPRAHIDVPTSCEQLVSDGVRAAQANDIDTAERSLASAVSCPGSDALRELAGVRLLQKRWSDVGGLAASAVAVDARDEYAWKLLGTARFIQDDPSGALEAWNQADEPRIDLVRIDGLAHTRHRVVERLVDANTGSLLTAGTFARTRRRLSELPSAISTRLDYVPGRSGLVEVRGVVVERPLLPTSSISLGMTGLSAAFTREVRFTIGSFTGGGERTTLAWRFWEHRGRIAFGVRAPAIWGGLWGIDAYQEEQAFTAPSVGAAKVRGMRVSQSNWASGFLRWNVDAGMDRWNDLGRFAVAGGGLRVASRRDRLDARLQLNGWLGAERFATGTASVLLRSSTERRGVVVVAMTATDLATASTPMDLWPAADTGIVKSTLLRAHPVLSHGRLRVDRLGRRLHTATGEAQRWWRVAGPLRAAAAAFIDVGGITKRSIAGARADADAGIGVRLSTGILPGTFRIDLARGLRDGATALSFVYEP
jgi:hypothetical protein